MAKPLTNSRSFASGRHDRSSSQRRTDDNVKMQNQNGATYHAFDTSLNSGLESTSLVRRKGNEDLEN